MEENVEGRRRSRSSTYPPHNFLRSIYQYIDFPRSRGPKDQDISNSYTNTSLTLKKAHLVRLIFNGLCSPLYPVKYEKHEGLPWHYESYKGSYLLNNTDIVCLTIF